jgi:hypothetical protein
MRAPVKLRFSIIERHASRESSNMSLGALIVMPTHQIRVGAMCRIASEALRRKCGALVFASVWVTQYENMDVEHPFLEGTFCQPRRRMG